jgi:hypothetical protein
VVGHVAHLKIAKTRNAIPLCGAERGLILVRPIVVQEERNANPQQYNGKYSR